MTQETICVVASFYVLEEPRVLKGQSCKVACAFADGRTIYASSGAYFMKYKVKRIGSAITIVLETALSVEVFEMYNVDEVYKIASSSGRRLRAFLETLSWKRYF